MLVGAVKNIEDWGIRCWGTESSKHDQQPPAVKSWPMQCLKKLGSFLLKYKWEIAGAAFIAGSIATAGMLTIVATIGLGLFGAVFILIGLLQKDCVNEWLDRKILERTLCQLIIATAE